MRRQINKSSNKYWPHALVRGEARLGLGGLRLVSVEGRGLRRGWLQF